MSKENKESKKDPELVYWDNKIGKITKPVDNSGFKDFYKKYINLNEIEDNEEESTFYEDQFYLYIKNKINDFIYGEKDNIIFFLGAGASVLGNKWEYGKTMSRLACEIINNLYFLDNNRKSNEEKLLSFQEFANLSNIKKPDNLKRKVADVLGNKKDKLPDFELEDFMSTLNQILSLAGEQHELFGSIENSDFIKQVKNTGDSIQQQITKLVQYKNYPFNASEESFQHLSIMKLPMSKLDKDESKLEMVTTNYDRVIEEAAEKGNITIFDGFGFDSNHVFNDGWFDWNLSKKSKESNTNEVEYNPNVIDLLKIHGSIDWVREKKDIVKKRSVRNRKKNQVMIFPSSHKYKQSYDKPYFELMSRFQNLLRKPNTWLITSGVSFNDDHISRMIIDAVKVNSGLRVLVTDYSLYNSSYDKIKDLISNNYDVAILKASMNDKDENHGLHFYLN